MPRKKGSTKAQKAERLDKICTMLAVVPEPRAVAMLAKEWELTPEQVRNLIREADEFSLVQRRKNAPYIRERQLQRLERLGMVCTAEKKYGPAVQAIIAEIKATAVLEDDDPEVDALILAHGLPPKDPAEAHIWLQRFMQLQLVRVGRCRSIDPLTKIRLLFDGMAKAGLMGDKAIVQEDLRQLKEADRAERGGANGTVPSLPTRRTKA